MFQKKNQQTNKKKTFQQKRISKIQKNQTFQNKNFKETFSTKKSINKFPNKKSKTRKCFNNKKSQIFSKIKNQMNLKMFYKSKYFQNEKKKLRNLQQQIKSIPIFFIKFKKISKNQ